MVAVQIPQAMAANPEFGTTAAETLDYSAGPIIFVYIEGCVIGGGTIAYINPGVYFGKIFVGHPEG